MALNTRKLRKLILYCCSAFVLVTIITKQNGLEIRQGPTSDPPLSNKTRLDLYVTSTDDTKKLCLEQFSQHIEQQVTVEVTRTAGGGVAGRLSLDDSVLFSWQAPEKDCTVLVLNESLALISVRTFGLEQTKGLVLAEYAPKFPKGSIVVLVYYKTPRVTHTVRTFSEYPKDAEEDSTVVIINRLGYRHSSTFGVLKPTDDVLKVNRQCVRGRVFPLKLAPVVYKDVMGHHRDLAVGGAWSPSDCAPRSNIAIIIPFRDREKHLWMFLENMISFLKLQQTSFSIFVINQAGRQLFNRASLMNIGYLEARKVTNFDCYIFHDVDTVPENLANLYRCDQHPRHLAVARNVSDYKSFTSDNKYVYFGGAIALTEAHIKKINGFSNKIFGWGGEDDEMYGRIKETQLDVLRFNPDIGSYVCFDHGDDTSNPHLKRRVDNLHRYGRRYWASDGLNTTAYIVLALSHTELYTNVSVVLPGPTDGEELIQWHRKQGQAGRLLRHWKWSRFSEIIEGLRNKYYLKIPPVGQVKSEKAGNKK